MGHDIFAYETKEIAYYRKSCFCEGQERLYVLLICEECNYGISGGGLYKLIFREDLLRAYETAKELEWSQEADFLLTILDKNLESVIIYFG